MGTTDFDYGKQINAENLVRLVLHTPNRQHFQHQVLAWAKCHGVTPQSVMADDGAVEEVAEDLSGPTPEPADPMPSVDPEPQPNGGDVTEPPDPA